MTQFKPGDKVICVNINGLFSLTLNKKYTISKCEESVTYIINDYVELDWYTLDRFKLDITEIRKEKLIKLNNYEIG